MSTFVLLGAGGHAKSLVESIRAAGGSISVYVDPVPSRWLDARHETDEQAVTPEDGNVIVGLGGLSPTKLSARLALLDRFLARDFAATPIIHPAAHVSPSAELSPGVAILGGAVVQPNTKIGRGAIINTGAIIEHDSTIGAGTHIAPGAIVLGDCRIGDCCFIGAGAVMLQSSSTSGQVFVPALTRHDGDK